MKREVFKRIISEWLERDLPKVLAREIKFNINTHTITAIVGPRRAGKTYLVFSKIKELLEHNEKEEILFIDFEDNRLIGVANEELDDIFTAHKELTDRDIKYIFFDEIQEIETWSKFVRRLYNLQKYTIVLTGSSSKLMAKEIATELRGRYKSILLLPFSFREYLKYKGFVYKKTTQYTEEKGKLMRFFDEYLFYGGYPEAIKLGNLDEKKELINSYYETIYYKDIIERYGIRNKEIIGIMMNYLLDINASLFSLTSFEKLMKSRGISISKKTISLYLKYLGESFFVFAIEKFSYSPKVRILNPKKVYLIDNIFHTLLSTSLTPDKGKLLESLVLQDLKRRNYDVYYFREKKECDFILKKDRRLVAALQVVYKLDNKNRVRELGGLKEAMSKLKIDKGIILTYDQEEDIKTNLGVIEVIPVWKWLLETSNIF